MSGEQLTTNPTVRPIVKKQDTKMVIAEVLPTSTVGARSESSFLIH